MAGPPRSQCWQRERCRQLVLVLVLLLLLLVVVQMLLLDIWLIVKIPVVQEGRGFFLC